MRVKKADCELEEGSAAAGRGFEVDDDAEGAQPKTSVNLKMVPMEGGVEEVGVAVVSSGCEGWEEGLRLRPCSSTERRRGPEKKVELDGFSRWSYESSARVSLTVRREHECRDSRQAVPSAPHSR